MVTPLAVQVGASGHLGRHRGGQGLGFAAIYVAEKKGDRAGFCRPQTSQTWVLWPAVSGAVAMLKGFRPAFCRTQGIVVGGGGVQSASVAR